MTNRLAVILGLLIVGALVADQVWNAGSATLFLLRRGFALLQWLIFWR